MVVDASAIIAILTEESDGDVLYEALLNAEAMILGGVISKGTN